MIHSKAARPKIARRFAHRFAFSMLELAVSITIIAIIAAVISQSGRTLLNARLANAQTITKSSPVPDINGLVVWFETTMPQSFDTASADDGKAISTWYDLSQNKNNAVAGTAPVYTSNFTNGLPVVKFTSASSQYLAFTGSDLANSNYTIFLVASRASTQSTNMIISGNASSAYQNLHAGWFSGPTFRVSHYGESVGNTDFVNYSTSSYVAPIFAIHSFNFDSSVGRYYFENGTQRVFVSSSQSKTPISSWSGSAIGRSTSSYFDGYVAEIIMYNRVLTTNERKDVEQYLGKKWGITVS